MCSVAPLRHLWSDYQESGRSSMLNLREAQVEDAEIISKIIRESFKTQSEILKISEDDYPNYVAFETVESVANRMDRSDTIVIAYLNDKPVGTVSFRNDPEEEQRGHIIRLAILPRFRGHSYGEHLMAYAETKLRERGVKFIELCIVAQFKRLREYYENLGYTPRETRSHAGFPFEILYMENKYPAIRK